MKWNWQQEDWPNFSYDSEEVKPLEDQLLYASGVLFGVFQHLSNQDKIQMRVELISDEALTTSAIEGEVLDRDSIQSSIRRHFGLQTDKRRIEPAERGISEMMIDLFETHKEPLSKEMLFRWHCMLCNGRRDLADVGKYRRGSDPMQVISGTYHTPKVHFEAPPASRLSKEMKQFLEWFHQTAPDKATPLSALIRSGIAHLYFVSIHPFEDGNGRIGRAVAEKALAGSLGQPTLFALSSIIEKKKKEYYAALEAANRSNDITLWLIYFSKIILKAQQGTKDQVEFLIQKSKLLFRLSGRINERQEKVLLRMFREGYSGFKGGLSAENYISITQISRQTATRDLQNLVELGVLTRKGERKGVRYFLNFGE